MKCLPPQNKPTGDEVNLCNQFLKAELNSLTEGSVILALGSIAHLSVLKAFDLKQSLYPFAHNIYHQLPSGQILVDSYHTSRYNVQTKRLTKESFADVFITIRGLLPK